MKNKIIMSKTIYILLKVLILTKADIISKHPDSDSIQDIAVFDNNDSSFTTSHLDSVSVRKKINEIPFANMSVISEMKMQRNESILSKPTSPRAFVEFHNGFLNEENIYVTFRWKQPEFTDEVIQGYTVQCWFIENLKEIQICDDKSISATILECTVHNLQPYTTYYFQVRAHTKVGAGPYTDLIDVSTTYENPIPQLLMVSENGIDKWDLDSNIIINFVKERNVKDATYLMAEHKIYWSNSIGELKMLDINEHKITKITNLQNIAYYLCIDWVARNLYWIEIDFGDIIKLDLAMWETGIVKYNKISKIKSLFYQTLNVLPSTGTLYWINYTTYDKPVVIQSDLDGKNAQMLQKNLSVICPLPLNNFTLYDIKIDDTNTKKPLIYWLTQKLFFVIDINVSMCNLILHAKEIAEDYFYTFMIDKTNIYIFTVNSYIYVLKKKYARLESVDAFKYMQKMKKSSGIHQMYVFGESLQSYPPIRCLTPDKIVYNIEVLKVTANSIIVNLPEPVFKNGCRRYNLSTTLYTIYISYCLDNEFNKSDHLTVQTYERYYEIQNLTPLTDYKLQLALSNFYSDRLSMDLLFGSKVILKTKPNKLDAPENVTVEALTPTIAAVHWMPPKKLNCVPVIYEVYWTSINLVNNTRQISEFLLINKTAHKINNTIIEPLIPGQKYRVYVRMYPANFTDHHNDSLSKTLYMYSEPNNIILNEININSMNISWIPSVNLTINYVLEYKNVEIEEQEWQIANISKQNKEGKIMYYIKNLLPGTPYEFRLILRYPKYQKNFIWPSDGRFTFSTLSSNTSDISSSPGIYNVVTQYYQYIISSFVAMIIVIFICYYLYRRRNKNNKQVLSSIMTDTELAILQEMPDSLLVHFNMSYNPILQYDSDEYVLIRITREQIKLEKLLGSGAFGMVYQGKVKNLGRTGIEISAAVKMLRKNASSQERKMFLEEARLMKYFRHKHVLRLLAICLDPECPSIVLELMETGDLLQYLRDSRKLQPSDSQALRLQDFFAICEDVARGCRYLEDLRFVHRDLACRNCLVSARDRENRVVKIGDFGLSRDIYNSDYYRKKGQDLLPIRWMAPESLVVGIFTSQSDVWSFGVIMWEITSLGEHPYTGRTNLEVIDYVRDGGKLPMPLNCPPTLYELMVHCWSSANDRPKFKLCLKNIISLRNNMEDTLLNPIDIIYR